MEFKKFIAMFLVVVMIAGNGKVSIRQAAVDAAADVPGEGTTPIKFYGDRSYTGKAWT